MVEMASSTEATVVGSVVADDGVVSAEMAWWDGDGMVVEEAMADAVMTESAAMAREMGWVVIAEVERRKRT